MTETEKSRALLQPATSPDCDAQRIYRDSYKLWVLPEGGSGTANVGYPAFSLLRSSDQPSIRSRTIHEKQ